MCLKIWCNEKSWKILDFWTEVNKALASQTGWGCHLQPTGGCRPTFSEAKTATTVNLLKKRSINKQSEKLCHLPCYHGNETELNRIEREGCTSPIRLSNFDIYLQNVYCTTTTEKFVESFRTLVLKRANATEQNWGLRALPAARNWLVSSNPALPKQWLLTLAFPIQSSTLLAKIVNISYQEPLAAIHINGVLLE